MKEEIIRISEKVFIHILKTDKFKSNIIAAFFLTDLNKNEITKNALVPAVLRRGTSKLQTMKAIATKMNDMYGALFDASTDKIGDKQAMQFYISCIDDKYALENEPLFLDSLNFLYDVIYSPKLVNGIFDEEYVSQEKETLRELIKSKINNKAVYANYRALEAMFEDDPYGIYKYGREEDLEEINAKNLYEQYTNILEKSEKHFYVAGDVDTEKIKEFFFSKFEKSDFSNDKIMRTKKSTLNLTEKKIIDKMEVTQGKLVLGYDVDIELTPENFYKMTMYNAILGGSSNSKLFQNVREKASLAYTTRSTYLKHKGVLLVTAGIELDKYDKALELIKIQVDDMKKGNFTDEDVRDAKVFLENIFNSCLDDEMTMIELSIGQFILGINDTIEEMIENIKKVTKEDIVEVANKLRPVVNYYLTK